MFRSETPEARRGPANSTRTRTVQVQWANDAIRRSRDGSAFTQTPRWGPLLFENESSDARDHCANERSTEIFLIPHPPYLWNTNMSTRQLPSCLPSHGRARIQIPANTPHLAFLSFLRLSVYMSVVSIAIILSFHLKDEPSNFELRMALPLGVVFWCLGLLCLALGFGNYVKTVTKYSRRAALVQTGWKTQTVSCNALGLGAIACSGKWC